MRKRHLVVLATLLLVFATPLRACDDEEAQAYLIDEVLRLSHEGVPDRIIIKQMRTMDFVFCLTADDIIELRELGVSDDVLEALIETSLDVEESRRQERVTVVRVSPGYWSPWYRYPCGWGAYYDPFPYQYSWNYYPFLYECGYWYGWSPNIYYYAYHLYDVRYDCSPHRGDYREENPQYVVERNRRAIIVDDPMRGPSAGGVPVATAPVVRPRTVAADDGILADRVDAGSVHVRGSDRSPIVVSPPSRRTENDRPLNEARSDVVNVRNPSTAVEARPTQPVVRPRSQPPVRPRTRDATPPVVSPRNTTQVKTPARIVPRRGSTTTRVTPPARRNSTIGTTPPRRTSTRTNPPKRTTTRVSVPPRASTRVKTPPAKRTPTRVTPPAPRTPVRTQVKAPARRTPPPPKATKPAAPKARSR